ncbi:4-hydroxy-3-methylbut-2-enyl diphosphate reductase [Perilla frutescens var. frutescens]|nr:4-hydroxy-3-methylbut-2-enyl diphosphate reductase [Perilla frutescens var. frutescens]
MDVQTIPLNDGKKEFEIVGEGDVVVLPAFGAAADEMRILSEKNVWNAIDKHKKGEYTSIIHGKYAHEEIVATVSFAGKYIIVMQLNTVENGTNTDNKSLSKFFKAVNADTQCYDDTVIELIHLPDEEDSRDACSSPKKSVSAYKRIVNCQNGVKTLIIFKDVDATLFEDHGDNPALPKSLDRLELSFSLPSVEELLGLVDMICAAEKAKIHVDKYKKVRDVSP